MVRGEIWWASLPEPIGSEPGFDRPLLIVQSNDFNQSKLSTEPIILRYFGVQSFSFGQSKAKALDSNQYAR